jgi:hypothetical protein
MSNPLNPHDPSTMAILWSRASDTLSWAASLLGLASAMGWVNLAVGVLSAAWLATQIYRFWFWEIQSLRLRRQAEKLTNQLARHNGHQNPTPPPQDRP